MSGKVTILELDGLEKTFVNGHRALDRLSLTVSAGAIYGFIGLNGAGKTTTIRIIAGLSEPDGGSVSIFGRRIERRDQWHKGRIGFVLDEPLYFPWMTAREYLHFVGTMYGLAPEESTSRSEELLDFLDLAARAEDTIETYSTGMKKKVSLAAAIIHKPDLVVLDEPLEGIDALSANAIKETLSMMASRGTSVFITSHVLDTIERLCTEIAIVHKGRILLQSTTEEIHERAREIVGDRTFGSLEELFLDLVSDRLKKKHLSYLG
jgi:ABC-2 type transport system ATP-binding protein